MPGDIWAQIEQDARIVATHQTFGHLFPDRAYYLGKVRISASMYNGGADILDESATLPCASPWWYDAICRFADDAAEAMETGQVAEFDISVIIVECEEELEQWEIDEEYEPKKWQEIQIAELTKKVLVDVFK